MSSHNLLYYIQHVYFQYFCRDRNAETRECRKARQEFERKISEEDNPKAFFKYVNSQRKVKPGIPNLKRSDETYTESDTEKASELNSFFKINRV